MVSVPPTVHAIVYVELAHTRLYAELIQVIESRQRSWVRPLCLCEYQSLNESVPFPQALYDIRGGADLVWPTAVFTEAIDTDMLPILMELSPDAPALGTKLKPQSPQEKEAKRKLNQFLGDFQLIMGDLDS